MRPIRRIIDVDQGGWLIEAVWAPYADITRAEGGDIDTNRAVVSHVEFVTLGTQIEDVAGVGSGRKRPGSSRDRGVVVEVE